MPIHNVEFVEFSDEALTASALCRLSALAVIDCIGHIQVMTSDQLVKLVMSVILNALTSLCSALWAVVINCCN